MDGMKTVSKHTKHSNPCLQKAADDEPIFVLRAQDASASQVIGYWLSINPQLAIEKKHDAVEVAQAMEAWPIKKSAD